VTERTTVDLPGSGTARTYAYDGRGRLVIQGSSSASTVPVTVTAGGFTVVRR
jgi:YD repeat-containing protein